MKLNKLFAFYFFTLVFLTIIAVWHLSVTKYYTAESIEQKNIFVKLTLLPDLSVSTASSYIRHRSISDIGSIFYIGPEIRTFFPGEFVYSPSINILKKMNNE